MSSDRKRVIVAGCGRITDVNHGRDLAGNPMVDVAWVDPVEAATAAMVAEFGGTAYTDLRAALDTERPHGVVIATPPAYHCALALLAAEAGAGILLEKGGKTAGQVRRILAAAQDGGVDVQMTFHQLLAIRPALEEARRRGPFQVRRAEYKWFRQDAPGPDGAFEDLVIHGIAMILEGFRWALPRSVRVTRRASEHYLMGLYYNEDVEPSATIEVACNHEMPVPEWVEVSLEADENILHERFRTTKTPNRPDYAPGIPPVAETRTQQSRLWVDSLGAESLLPVHGELCLKTQVVLDAGRDSLASDGAPAPVDQLDG